MNSIINFLTNPRQVVKWAAALIIAISLIWIFGIVNVMIGAIAFWLIYWVAMFLRYLAWACMNGSWNKSKWRERYD